MPAPLCEALPSPACKGGGKLPLNLHCIASQCSNSFFAPRRFAAIQLAFSTPRSRVLSFRAPPNPLRSASASYPPRLVADTGRIVGTGCDSPQAARLAVARAQRQVCYESGVLLRLRNFAVNQPLRSTASSHPAYLTTRLRVAGHQPGERRVSNFSKHR